MNRAKILISITVGLMRAYFAASALALLAPNAAHAAPGDAANATGQAQVVITMPLQIAKEEDLEFGRIAVGQSAGTVTVNPANSACTTTGATQHLGTCIAAGFVGMGSGNTLVALRVENISQLTGPGAPMNLTDLQIGGSASLSYVLQVPGQRIYRIDPATGVFHFTVGGTLNVSANQMPGAYQGSFDVRIDYF